MPFRSRLRLAGLPLVVALTPGVLAAQDAIEPAAEVRVVELADAVHGRVRVVIDDPSPAEVLRVQVELARHGHDPGVRNGVLDPATRRALAAFQAERGLVICSCLSYETVVALGIEPVVVARAEGGRGYRPGGAYVEPWPRVYYHDRYRGYSAAVFVGHVPDGIFIGHEPARKSLDRRPHRGDGRSRPARPDPSDDGLAPPPDPRSGGRIRGADPVPGSRPGAVRPAPPGGRIAGGTSRPAPPSRPGPPSPRRSP